MLISFDTEAKVMYIELSEAKVVRTEEFAPEVFLDFDEAGNLLGIELLNPGKLKLQQIAKKFDVPQLRKIPARPVRQIYQSLRT